MIHALVVPERYWANSVTAVAYWSTRSRSVCIASCAPERSGLCDIAWRPDRAARPCYRSDGRTHPPPEHASAITDCRAHIADGFPKGARGMVISNLTTWRIGVCGQISRTAAAALATVVGVLIEVPVMLSLVRIINARKGWLEQDQTAKT